MLLSLLLLAVAELFVIVQVVHAIGVLDTLALLVIVSVIGAALMRRAGLGVWQRAQRRVEVGEVPGRELVDGLLVLASGAFLVVPGFLTDAIGLLLLLPPVRAVVRRRVTRRFTRRASVVVIEGRARPARPPELEP